MPSQPVLEINPQHPLVRRLNRDTAEPRLAEWAHVLFNQAVLTLGARIEDPPPSSPSSTTCSSP